MFPHLLREASIGVHLEAPNREAALAEMIALLPGTELHPRQKAELLEQLLQREEMGTTAIGEGIALPHCVCKGLDRTLVSLGISRRGISYPSLDGDPVYVLLLIAFHENCPADEKRAVLSEVENLLRDRFLRARLRICESPAEAYEILQREAAYVPVWKVASGQ